MLTASADKTARLWDVGSGECVQVLEGHSDEIFSCAFNYDANAIITGLLPARGETTPFLPAPFAALAWFCVVWFGFGCTGSKDNTCRIWKPRALFEH